jgi:transposase-like protein
MEKRGAVVTTVKIKKITERLCGLSFSKNPVSGIVKKLDTEIQAWLNRPLEEEYPYVFVDARFTLKRAYWIKSETRIKSGMDLLSLLN